MNEEKRQTPEEVKECLRKLDALPPETQQAALKFLQVLLELQKRGIDKQETATDFLRKGTSILRQKQ